MKTSQHDRTSQLLTIKKKIVVKLDRVNVNVGQEAVSAAYTGDSNPTELTITGLF